MVISLNSRYAYTLRVLWRVAFVPLSCGRYRKYHVHPDLTSAIPPARYSLKTIEAPAKLTAIVFHSGSRFTDGREAHVENIVESSIVTPVCCQISALSLSLSPLPFRFLKQLLSSLRRRTMFRRDSLRNWTTLDENESTCFASSGNWRNTLRYPNGYLIFVYFDCFWRLILTSRRVIARIV